MPKITIDGREVSVPDGTTILSAAGSLGIDIPSLCFRPGCKAETSCMVCVVRVVGRHGLVPSCATEVEEGMVVESDSDEVRRVRVAALELLVSDHVGDCIAPCQLACPLGMNIPLMIRQIRSGLLQEAIATVKADIALPAVLGRICDAPCEKACRRAAADQAVAIRLLKRHVADADLARPQPYLPPRKPPSGKSVAVVGSGPAALAAAYHLLLAGHGCTVFDDRELPGGTLRYGVDEAVLERDVLDAEIAVIEKLGAEFRLNVRVGGDTPIATLQRDWDAILLAVGEVKPSAQPLLPDLRYGQGGIEIDRLTFETSVGGVFAVGSAVKAGRSAVRSVRAAREAARAIDLHLTGVQVTAARRPFSTHVGRMQEGEIELFLAAVDSSRRTEPPAAAAFSDDGAVAEAALCLHCDCRKSDNCKLRDACDELGVKSGRYSGPRRLFEQHSGHELVVYEPGKCIACGLCVQIASRAGEELGLTFVGRGFDIRVGVPFGMGLREGLKLAAERCVEACPTGALAMKDQ